MIIQSSKYLRRKYKDCQKNAFRVHMSGGYWHVGRLENGYTLQELFYAFWVVPVPHTMGLLKRIVRQHPQALIQNPMTPYSQFQTDVASILFTEGVNTLDPDEPPNELTTKIEKMLFGEEWSSQ